jgi:hypothetical protein
METDAFTKLTINKSIGTSLYRYKGQQGCVRRRHYCRSELIEPQ